MYVRRNQRLLRSSGAYPNTQRTPQNLLQRSGENYLKREGRFILSKCVQEKGLMDVLIGYAKNVQASGKGRRMTVTDLAAFLEDLITLKHDTIATAEILTVARDEVVCSPGHPFPDHGGATVA